MEAIVTVAAILLTVYAILHHGRGPDSKEPKKPGRSNRRPSDSEAAEQEQDELDWDTDEYN